MVLKDFIRDNPDRKIILLWFDNNKELQTKYVYQDQLNNIPKDMLKMEVMETDTFDEEATKPLFEVE